MGRGIEICSEFPLRRAGVTKCVVFDDGGAQTVFLLALQVL